MKKINITIRLFALGMLVVLGILYYLWYVRYEGSLEQKAITKAKISLKRPSYSEAMIHISIALDYNKRNWEAYLLWAKIEMQQYQDYSQALYCLSKAIGYCEHPTAAMFYLRGKCYYKVMDFDKALKDLQRAQQMGSKADSLSHFLKAAQGIP